MNKYLDRALTKVLFDKKLAKHFFDSESLEESYEFLQQFEQNFSIRELCDALREITTWLEPEDLQYIANQKGKLSDIEKLYILINEANKRPYPGELTQIDHLLESMSILNEKKTPSRTEGRKVGNRRKHKKLICLALASLIAVPGNTRANCERVQTPTVKQQIRSTEQPKTRRNTEELTKDEKSVWLLARDKFWEFWEGSSKKTKAALISIPVIGILYSLLPEHMKISEVISERMAEYKLAKKLTDIKIKKSLTDKAIQTQNWMETLYYLGAAKKSYQAANVLCNIWENDRNGKEPTTIGDLPYNTLCKISDILGLIGSCPSLVLMDQREDPLGLVEWTRRMKSKVQEKLFELNRETLRKHGLTVQKTLDSGITASVYLCTNAANEKLEVTVIGNHARKMIASMLEREKGAWKTVRNIQGNNFVRYHGCIEEQEDTCFIMDYVEGGKNLENVTPKDSEQAMMWAKELFQGLSALHEKNIAHRDIKFANILVKDGHIKICDSGLAAKATSTRATVGTLNLAPDEIFPKSPLQDLFGHYYDGKAVDVYLAALTVYRLLFDIPESEVKKSAQNALKTDKLNKDRFGNPVKEEMKKFFRECLSSDPQKRPSAKEALKLLERIKINQ